MGKIHGRRCDVHPGNVHHYHALLAGSVAGQVFLVGTVQKVNDRPADSLREALVGSFYLLPDRKCPLTVLMYFLKEPNE